MASGIFAILDDIGSLMDDVALTAKVAARKTAGILGDDLAVNAEKATGFLATRELPVLWAITKGSFLNKLIIIPAALLLSAVFPPGITTILILGGFYLAYEGIEKIIDFISHRSKPANLINLGNNKIDPPDEKTKIRAAIRTDLVLSMEIVIIALASVFDRPLVIQIATVAIVGILATIGVYGLVALIVRMDDMGYYLISKTHNKGLIAFIGRVLVRLLPWTIKILSITGTFALLLVAGGIFSHHIAITHYISFRLPALLDQLLCGLIGGVVGYILFNCGKKLSRWFAKSYKNVK